MVEREFKVMRLASSSIDRGYQREHSLARVKKIASDFKAHMCRPLVVARYRISEFDEYLDYITDGWTRSDALLMLYGPDAEWMVEYWTGLTRAEAAEQFSIQVTTAKVPYRNIYKAGLISGTTMWLNIEAARRSNNLKIAGIDNARPDNSLNCIAYLKDIYLETMVLARKDGEDKEDGQHIRANDHINELFRVIRGSFGINVHVPANIVRGLSRFMRDRGDGLDVGRLIVALRESGISGINTQVSCPTRGHSPWGQYADAIAKIYVAYGPLRLAAD